MRRLPVNPEELFDGAMIQHRGVDTYTAIITKIADYTVDLVDIYEWKKRATCDKTTIIPRHVDAYVLRRFGFVKGTSALFSGWYQLDIPDTIINMANSQNEWRLYQGDRSNLISYAHELQLAIKQLCGYELRAKPLDVQTDNQDSK
ncbi:hypothetical protein [Spirosoma flavum]|uniref:DNA-directed DNA polymerase n=1 Tax=Spirosoma flavum TaxID=2048557 RepID=A0ABW6AQ35_9BACT